MVGVVFGLITGRLSNGGSISGRTQHLSFLQRVQTGVPSNNLFTFHYVYFVIL